MARYTKQDILNMTVAEFVDRTNFKVKLGAKRDSAFIYCGEVGSMSIDELDEAIINGYKLSLRNTKQSIKAIQKQPQDYESFRKKRRRSQGTALAKLQKQAETEQLKDHHIASQVIDIRTKYASGKKAYEKWLAEQKHRLAYLKDVAKRTEDRLNKYTSIGSRKLIEMYPSCIEDETYIVLFDGKENGSFWTTQEYESGVIDYGEQE